MISIGVIGGGQLARMMIPRAQQLGLEIKVFSEADGQSADLATTVVGDYTKYSEIEKFAKTVDVITFDHEHVPAHLLEQLVAAGHRVQPMPTALKYAQNKLLMRKRLSELAVPMPKWSEVQTQSALEAFLSDHPEAIVKTPIGGYDGKGVRVVREVSDVSDWFADIETLGGSLLAEEKVDFVREIAVLSARNEAGEFRAWQPVQTTQLNGVCHQVISPAPELNSESAIAIARTVSESLETTGVMAVEMFETASGELLINELAMRPHNSGHFSMDACITDQFEQHLRAVANLPLGDTGQVANWAVMVNLLGQENGTRFIENYRDAMSAYPDVKFHNYGKQPRLGRKMGHLNIIGSDLDALILRIHNAADSLSGQ